MELEKIKKEIEDFSKGKFDLFYCNFSPPIKSDVPYVLSARGYKEFLEFAERQHVKVIYFIAKESQQCVEDSEHTGELALIEIGFMLDGVYHSHFTYADWYKEFQTQKRAEEKIPKTVDKQNWKAIDSKTDEEWAKEIIDHINTNHVGVYEGKESLWETIELGMEEKGLDRRAVPWDEKELRRRVDNIYDLALREVKKKKLVRERELLPKFIEECVTWALNNQLKTIHKYNVRAFLDEKEIDWESTSVDSLKDQVNTQLKKKR